MKVYEEIVQGTPEWHAIKCGVASASCFSDIMAKGQGKMRAKYMRRVVAEILTGKTVETFRNADTDRGTEQEPLARWSYEILTGNTVEQVGFISHDKLRVGCSPDGLVLNRTRGAEIKSVIPTVQIDTVDGGGYPSEHKAQIQGGMWITGFESWDFCSYSPLMPAHLRTYIFTVQRDAAYIDMVKNEVLGFLADVDRMIERLNNAGKGLETLLRESLEKVPA